MDLSILSPTALYPLCRPTYSTQVGEQEGAVFGPSDIELPAIAPGDHVHRAPWGDDARSARHPNAQHGAHEILNQRISLQRTRTGCIDRRESKSPISELK